MVRKPELGLSSPAPKARRHGVPAPVAEHPCITIGIACFDAQATIGAAVASALAQDWPNVEVLVVDDCSTDRSPRIVEEMARTDRRIRLIRHSCNTGPGGVRQTIVENAEGELIAFFDDDDESDPSRLTVQSDRIREFMAQAGTDLVACYASGGRLYPNGYYHEAPAIGSRGAPLSGEAVAEYLLFHAMRPSLFYGSGTPSCALLAPTATLRRLGGFDASFRRVEDIDFAVRLALAGGHFIGCPERLYCQHATVADDKTPRKNYESEMRLLEKHKAFLLSRGRYGYARRWFTMRYHHFIGAHGRMAIDLVGLWLRHPLAASRHLLSTGPARLLHERRMRRRRV